MVDFNNEITVSTPPANILKILILQRRNDVIDSFENYFKFKIAGGSAPTHIIKSRLLALINEVYGSFDESNANDFINLIPKADIEELKAMFNQVNKWLYKKNVTKFDTRQVYDRTRVELENKAKGL